MTDLPSPLNEIEDEDANAMVSELLDEGTRKSEKSIRGGRDPK